MKKKLNRFIALILAGVLSAGAAPAVFADGTAGDTTAINETGAAKSASEATEAPQATADAPAAKATAEPKTDIVENEKFYNEAIGFLTYLGIFKGDEKGDMKPDEYVTRAEIAAIILREMNITNMLTYENVFNDVDESHWAASVIQTAYSSGIINGYEDGSFGPDEEVTFEQAVKMVMCAINYQGYAETFGGYPEGYLKLAYQEDVANKVDGKLGEPMTRRNIAKLVYNSLTAPYPTLSGMTAYGMKYTKDEDVTILSELHHIYYDEGTITAANGKAMDISSDVLKNQIAFEGEVMESELANAENYVGEYVRLFYRDLDGKGNDTTALYAISKENKTETMTINAGEIDYIKTGYTGSSTSQISYYSDEKHKSKKRIKLVDQPTIVYNGQPFTAANFSSLEATKADGSAMDFDEFITPYEGTVKAVDFGKDGTYDALFVESYETSVVKLATALRLQLEYPISFGDIIKLDTTENPELNVKVIRDEEEIELRELQEGDVVSVRMNANFTDPSYTGDKYITIEASYDYFDGTVKSFNTDEDGCYVTIDDTEYEVVEDEDVRKDIKAMLGTSGKFYMNKFGRIAKADGKVIGGLSSGEKYGWLVNVYTNESGSDVFAKLFTQDGSVETMQLADRVDYWAPDATENKTVSASEIDSYIDNTVDGNSYFVSARAIDSTEKAAIRLCKFKTNSSGRINRLYIAVDEKTVSENSSAVRVSTTDLKEANTRSGLFAGKYVLESGVPQITAPLHFEDLNDSDNYGYRIADKTEFSATTGDVGVGYNCYFGDISDSQPGVIIRLVKSATAAQEIVDYNTADDNPVIVVTGIGVGVDADDEEVYIIKGIRDGKEVQYTTAKNVLVANVNPKVRLDKETYDTTTIWTKDSDVPLNEVLHAGDICGIDGSASNAGIILRMVDATALASYVRNGGEAGGVPDTQFKFDELFSPSRDRVVFGYVTDVRTSPIVQFDLAVDGSEEAADDDDDETTAGGSPIVTVGVSDLSRAVQFVNIARNGRITVDKEVSDAYEVETGDYVFMRNFKNDAARELYVIRFE